jgi:putative tryptophan/tyrosine transport system substrate-binding protein
VRRRKLLLLICGTIASSVGTIARSQGRVPRICYLGNTTLAGSEHLVQAWLAGLREHGWIEGQNLKIDFHWGEARLERIEKLAAQLVKERCELIFASGMTAARITSWS